MNVELLKKLEKTIDTINPERGKVPIKILGYGEISLVFELLDDSENIAYKRIPIFDNENQVTRHVWAYNQYNRILRENCNLNIPNYDTTWFKDDQGQIQFYCIQEKIHPDSVCNKLIHRINDDDIKTLVILVMGELKKVWAYSRKNRTLKLGLDGQISNFAIKNYNPNNLIVNDATELYYLDTSTPLFRINGKEAMEAVLFLKSTPSFLRFLIKALFLQDTVDRYYDFRRVVIDLIANFYKEQKSLMVSRLIKSINEFLNDELPEFNVDPLTLKEVQKYYKSDANMWRIFQAARKIDRFLKLKLFKKNYAFYLPGKIKR